jgi:hypothetical protein
MISEGDDRGMIALFLLLGLLALCVLSVRYGADSRFDEPNRHRRNL